MIFGNLTFGRDRNPSDRLFNSAEAEHAPPPAAPPLRAGEREMLRLYRALAPRRAALVLNLARYLAGGETGVTAGEKM